MDSSTLIAVGALITAGVAGYIALRTYQGNQKKADLVTVEEGYAKLQTTYLAENERLNLKVDKLQNEKDALDNQHKADKVACDVRIAELETKLTILMTKLPEPGATQSVIIAGIDTVALPALPVKLTGVEDDLIVPMELKKPIPLTIKQIADAAAAAADEKQAAAG